jgi:hypothetical protein
LIEREVVDHRFAFDGFGAKSGSKFTYEDGHDRDKCELESTRSE